MMGMIAGDGSDADVKNIPTGLNKKVEGYAALNFCGDFLGVLGAPLAFFQFLVVKIIF